MNRREILRAGSASAAMAVLANGPLLASAATGSVRVAFLLGPNANVIDATGPWEVFQYFLASDPLAGRRARFFELFTVADTRDPVRMTGGLRIVPDYSLSDAPQPQVVIVPDMEATPSGDLWLQRVYPDAEIVASVCTGAFQLARLGLFDGKAATTHHRSYDRFAARFPNVDLQRGRRFVDSGKVMSAGGLTSGIDLALHIVRRYFGDSEASELAAWLEHDSAGWRTGIRA